MSSFLLGVVQTTLGSALGFVSGIIAFQYQQSRQSAKKEKDEWRAALDALNRLSTAAGANIEALAMAKLQLINDMKPDVEKMKAASKAVYDTPVKDRAEMFPYLKDLSGIMQHFYKSLPRIPAMQPPIFYEYSSLSKDMPALTLFVHRAMGMMQQLDDLIASRNIRIAEHAREGGTDSGMSAERLLYYSSMLADEGEAICEYADFSLNSWRLVLDQVKAYMQGKAKGEHFLEYTLVPLAVAAMPEEELFPLMREQLTIFND